MKSFRAQTVLLAAVAFLPGFLGRPALAEGFPPISDADRALTSVPNEPNAAAVVLFKKSEFELMGYGTHNRVSSRLLVQERRKILTEKGKELAEVGIVHSDYVRLSGFKGRTVLPDGRVLPIGDETRFERKVSRRQKRSVTSVAFPGVEVGAILDYQYELRFDSFFYLEPWYLSDELPVLHSEIVFKIPPEIRVQAWTRDPLKVGVHTENKRTRTGTEARVWADNVPAVPDEPFGPPYGDLATTMMMLPTAYDDGVAETKLLESWASVCKLLGDDYEKALKKDGDAARTIREVAGSTPGGTPREKAEAVYRFVRDRIETVHEEGVFPLENSTVGKTFAGAQGNYLEKALLLKSLLDRLKLQTRLVWAANRWYGPVDPQVVNPGVFDRALVAVTLDGQRVFLDPSDRALAFGQLRAAYEATPALLFDDKKPEMIVLPDPPFDQNRRQAVVDLDLDAEGRLTGKGEVVFTGQHSWSWIHWKEDDAATLEGWKTWLEGEYEGFAVEGIQFQELPDEQTAKVSWTMKQREEEVLGDEASVPATAPLGPSTQPFVQQAEKRRTPVMFGFADRDETELRLRWPEGWKVDTKPAAVNLQNKAGALAVSVEVDEAGRSLVYRRKMDIVKRELTTTLQYHDVRTLYGKAEKSDAEPLALVRR